MRPLLRLCEWFPTLVSGAGVEGGCTLPSYGAMAACDACLEAVAAMAGYVPVAVAPFAATLTQYVAVFFDKSCSPPEVGKGTGPARLNASMVRYERERWERRVQLAKKIVQALAQLRGDEVLVALLVADRDAPPVLRNCNDQRLRDIVVKAQRYS